MPHDLSADTWTMIKVYKEDTKHSFVKNSVCTALTRPVCRFARSLHWKSSRVVR
jgi:hypothetical protein